MGVLYLTARWQADSVRLTLRGAGVTAYWPEGAVGVYTEDDVRIEPGLAVLAAGRGAIGGQGKPAAKLALWSLIGEVRSGNDLARGFERAHEAVKRLTWSWHPNLSRPFAMMAAIQLMGGRARIALAGDCRVSRVKPTALEPLTEVERIGGRFVAHVVGSGEPYCSIREVPVAAGDRFVLGDNHLHEYLSDDAIRACTTADALRELVMSTREYGTASFILVDVVEASPGKGVGTSAEPARSWLYSPGEDLSERDPVGAGPDPTWFEHIWRLVM